MKIWSALILLAAVCAIGCGVGPAEARTLYVGACTSARPDFTTIQAAVNAALAKDKVVVCPGSYAEQVTIPVSLTLTAFDETNPPEIVSPALGVVQNATSLGSSFPIAAQILVAAAPGAVVKISYITVDGSINDISGCGLNLIGIYYQNTGGEISNTTLQNQLLDPSDQGCQNGDGIFVENNPGLVSKVAVLSNTVSNFDKNGITFHLAGASGTISKNIVTGIGPTNAIAQNGIEVAYGATAVITLNNVSNLVYTPASYAASGILLYSVAPTTAALLPKIQENTVSSAQYGIVLDGVPGLSGSLLQVTKNTISGSAFAGVGLDSDIANTSLSNDYIAVGKNTITNTDPYDAIDVCSDNNTISHNTIANATESGIHLDDTCPESNSSASGNFNTVSSNSISVACAGILSGPNAVSNTVGTNHYVDVTNNIVSGSNSCPVGPTAAKPGALLGASSKSSPMPPPAPARD